jgi:predicted esterase
MRRRVVQGVALAAVLGLSGAAWAKDAKGKEKGKPAPQTGIFKLTATSPIEYILMSVPKDYDPKRYYPLMFLLHPQTDDPEGSKPEPYVEAWTPIMSKRGWIIAAPKSFEWNYDTSIDPIKGAVKRVTDEFNVDDRRMVLVGHNAGALMAWRMATLMPDTWTGIMAFSGEVHAQDRGNLKNLEGKPAYVFRGENEKAYAKKNFDSDIKLLQAVKVKVTPMEKKGWTEAMPTPELGVFAKWLDEVVYPEGAWREKAEAVEKATAAKDFPAASKALTDLAAELKRRPYPAFNQRAADLQAAYLDAGRAVIEEPARLAESDAFVAIAKMEEVVKGMKGAKDLEAEAKKAQAALMKLPAVTAALGKKKAEADGASYMERAAAAEAKGDLPRALDAYRKAAALDWSKKAEAESKVLELAPKVGK